MHRVIHDGDSWCIVDTRGKIVCRKDTNAAAWREADKLDKQPMSRQQETSDWSFKKRASGE